MRSAAPLTLAVVTVASVLALVVVVGVQSEPIERLATPGAAVAVLAPAADPHHLAAELRARVEALPFPQPAVGAWDEPDGHAARLTTGERLKLVRCRVPPTFGEVANHEVG